MKRLALVAAIVLAAVAAWGLQPTCGIGSQIAIANVLWSEQHVLLAVNETRITQATTNFGALRQNAETWFGGIVHPTHAHRILHVFFGDASGLQSATMDLEALGFWLFHGNIYTWQPLLRWDWSASAFVRAAPEEVRTVMDACARPGGRCDDESGYTHEKLGWSHRRVPRGFNGSIELGGGTTLSFRDEPGGPYRIAISTAGRETELFVSLDHFGWEDCPVP